MDPQPSISQPTTAPFLPETAAILAFDVGGTRIKAGIVCGTAVSELRIEPLNPVTSGDELIQTLVRIGDEMRTNYAIQAVGISMKGIIDPKQGTVLDVKEALVDLIGTPLAQRLALAYQLPTCIENDARMYTLGELLYGAGREAHNLLCLTLGTGVGSGVVLNRRVLRGTRGVSGILGGHITIQVDGPICTCGNIGCLEALVGTAALVKSAYASYAALHEPVSVDEPLTPQAIFAQARSGSPAARAVVETFTRYLSAGIVSLIHANDPDLVVLGGGIAGSAQQFLPTIQAYVDEHTWALPRGRVPVAIAKLGDAAALVGVAALARGLDVLL